MTAKISGLGVLAVVLALGGCGTDAADDAGGGGVDAGMDAGVGVDAGVDAGEGLDAGVDAAVMDAGPNDAHIDWPDGGGISDPVWVDLTVGAAGSCTPFTACGGDVTGTWDLNGGCFEIDIESAISTCPGATVTRREGRGRGRVIFDGAAAYRVAESVVEADTFFPAVCTAFYSCAMLETAMRMLWTEATCVSETSGDCNCTTIQRTFIDQRDLYTTTATEIVGTVSDKRWEYCIAADRLDYRDVSPMGMLEPGEVELLRR